MACDALKTQQGCIAHTLELRGAEGALLAMNFGLSSYNRLHTFAETCLHMREYRFRGYFSLAVEDFGGNTATRFRYRIPS